MKLLRSHSLAYPWDKTIDVFHLDADHEYQAVTNDIEKFAPFLADEGIIVFDDYDAAHPGVKQAVHELLLKRRAARGRRRQLRGVGVRQHLPEEPGQRLAALTRAAERLVVVPSDPIAAVTSRLQALRHLNG